MIAKARDHSRRRLRRPVALCSRAWLLMRSLPAAWRQLSSTSHRPSPARSEDLCSTTPHEMGRVDRFRATARSSTARLAAGQPARRVRTGIDETNAAIRHLVHGLRPPLIDELGLVVAVRNHPSAHPVLELTVSPEQLPELHPAVDVALYRIVSEAIHNAVRHSGDTRCVVVIEVGASHVQTRISDDGRGVLHMLDTGANDTTISRALSLSPKTAATTSRISSANCR